MNKIENEIGRFHLSKEMIESLPGNKWNLTSKDYDEKGIYIIRVKQEAEWDLCLFLDKYGVPILNDASQYQMIQLYLELELQESIAEQKKRVEAYCEEQKEIEAAMRERRHPNIKRFILSKKNRGIFEISDELDKLHLHMKNLMVEMVGTKFFKTSYSLDSEEFKKIKEKLHSK